ncbi:MAG: glycerol-3-phosphate 1-O-acyltransferase PlsY [Clostridia bacterium]|nr:glycerol-3-phosphate 1-O-acyltransferase PlsY [Clostridia bacterium]
MESFGYFLQNSWLALLLAAVCGYLMGSINWAIIITRTIFRKDIRSEGSGNAGATNVLRNHGRGPAILTTIGDIGKSMAAVVVGGWLVSHLQTADLQPYGYVDWIQQNLTLIGGYIGGFFCLLGHDFPVFYGFRGGKGVLAALGMFLLLDWKVALASLAIFVVIVAISRMVSLGSMVSIGCGVVMVYFSHNCKCEAGYWMKLFCGGMALLVWLLIVFQHRANIRRIIAGTESRLGGKKKDADQP